MLINPVVDTRYYIDGIEVITPRGVAKRIPEMYDNTVRKWLRLPTAPLPVAVNENGLGELFYNAEEALAFINQVLAKQAEWDALGLPKRGRPRKAR